MTAAAEERDLSFAPVRNERPRALRDEQIEFYNREGYLTPFRIFDDAEAARVRAYFDDLLATMQAMNDGRDTYAINGYHTRCRSIYELVMNRRIVELVSDLVGENVICWGTHFFCKMPHDPRAVPWHQDASYWPLTPARTVTAWLAIDDADAENSAMQFIPRTHTLGHLKWKQTQQPAVLGQEIEQAEALGKPVVNVLRAGEMSLHADMLAHGSDPNRSARRRCGLTMRFCPPTVVPLNPCWGQNAILCRGRADGSPWQFPPLPQGEDVSPRNKPRSIGAN